MNVSYFTVMTATELLQSQAVAVVSAGLHGRALRSVGRGNTQAEDLTGQGKIGLETGRVKRSGQPPKPT